MRRLISIAILLLLALPLVTPALGQTPQSHLLLCCRKGGAHHCMNVMTSDVPMVHQHCPAFRGASLTGHSAGWMLSSIPNLTSSNAIEDLKIRQVEAGYRISFHRSRQKRGPPAVRLS